MKKFVSFAVVTAFLVVGTQALFNHQRTLILPSAKKQALRDAPNDDFIGSNPQLEQAKQDIKKMSQEHSRKSELQAQERKNRADALIGLRLKLEKQITSSVGKRKNHFLADRVFSDGQVADLYKQSLNALGEARLLHTDVQAELGDLTKRAMMEESSNVQYGNGKALEGIIKWEVSERARLEATLRILKDILKDKYGTNDLSPREGRDYAIVEENKHRVSHAPETL